MELFEILSYAQDMNSDVRKKAELYLNDSEFKNPLKFYSDLVQIFAKESMPSGIRGLAGLILKNKIDPLTKEEEKKKDFNINQKFFREEIKGILLKIFESPSKIARRTSSQIYAKISKIEIIEDNRTDVFRNLYTMTSEKKSQNFQCSVLETIEFICQEYHALSSTKALAPFSTEIFNIISNSISQSLDNEIEIKFSGLNALSCSIFLMKDILKEKITQQLTFKIIFQQLESKEKKIRRVVFEILDKIAQDYYNILEDHILIIFHSSLATIKKDHEIVVLQAIELWSTIADIEFELTTNSIQAVYEGRNPFEYSRHFILQSSTILSSFLLELIKEKNIEYENDEWNCCAAAGTCLNLISQVAPGEIIPDIVSFIENNLFSTNPSKSRESASLAFVAILDGLGSKMMYNHVIKTLPSWLYYLEEENPNVQSMISWTIGKISCISPYLLRGTLGKVVQLTIQNLNVSKTVYKTCWSLNEIFQSFGKEGSLDWCIEGIFFSLMNFILYQKPENFVTDELFEIFCSMILNSSTRNKIQITSLVPTLFLKLRESLSFEDSESAKKIQSHMCRVIGCSIQRIGKKMDSNFTEKIINLIIQTSSIEKKGNYNWVLEEELLVCIGTIVQKMQKKITVFLGELVPFLIKSIKNGENFQVSSLAIGILGDVCRCTEINFKPFIERAALSIFSLLQNPKINPNLKPLVLVCLGDIALSDESFWENFSSKVLKIFKEASGSFEKFSNLDEMENREWVLSMKESLIEGMVGIIQSFQNDNRKKGSEEEYIKLLWIPKFLQEILSKNRKLRTTEACLGLIGDLSLNFPLFKKTSISYSWVRQILFEAKNNRISKVKTLGSWIYELVLN